jgi:putative membrane protein
MDFITNNIPRSLLYLYGILFIVFGVTPLVDRTVWFATNITAFVIMMLLVWLYNHKTRFSHGTYYLMSIFPLLSLIGGYYGINHVPCDWLRTITGMQKDAYEQLLHFSFGLYALPLVEYMLAKKKSAKVGAEYVNAFAYVVALAGLYEVASWKYAISRTMETGISILSSRGDIWGPQKNILATVVGALVVLLISLIIKKLSKKSHKEEHVVETKKEPKKKS